MLSQTQYKLLSLVLLAAIPTSSIATVYYYQSSSGDLSRQVASLQDQVNTWNIHVANLTSEIDSLKSQISQLTSHSSNGPLVLYYDYNSFNFTQGTETVPHAAFCIPFGVSILFWLRIANSATDSSVTLRSYSAMILQPYGPGGTSASIVSYIVDSSSVNPNNTVGYSDAQPDVLPTAPQYGPMPSITVKFGSTVPNGATAPSFSANTTYVILVSLYYIYRGELVGITFPFVAIRAVTSYPGAC